MNPATRRPLFRIGRFASRGSSLSSKLAIWLIVACTLSLLLPGRASANSNEITAFTAKSTKYNTYYSSRGCGSCHMADQCLQVDQHGILYVMASPRARPFCIPPAACNQSCHFQQDHHSFMALA